MKSNICANVSMAREDIPLEDMVFLLKNAPPSQWPESWHGWQVTRDAHVYLWEELLENPPSYPGTYDGRGIVMSVSAKPGWSSGKELKNGYFPGAWVAYRELRRLGCNLPVMFAHMGFLEWDEALTRLCLSSGIQVMDMDKEAMSDPMRILCGWESKVYSIIKSPFKEVLYLDADNIPLVNPEFLFDTDQYKYFGTLLWPDVPPYDRKEWLPKDVWDNMGLPHMTHVRACESGQLLINKEECWKELCLARLLNEHSDWVYKWIFGDKDTFVLAWEKAAYYESPEAIVKYAMTHHGAGGNSASLFQRDFNGRPIFQHCTRNKPTIDGYPHPNAILARKSCQEHLDELRGLWSGRLWQNDLPSREEVLEMQDLMSCTWIYERKNLGSREMRFLEDHRIGKGLMRCEVEWNVFVDEDGPMLVISDIDGKPTCHFRKDGESWSGKWLEYEMCETYLTKAAHSA